MRRLWLTSMVLAGALVASPARGQDLSPPRLEIGGNVIGVVSIFFEDGPAVVGGGGPRVTVNITPRLAIDLLSEVIGGVDSSGTTALYQIQLAFPIRESSGGGRTLSFTVGAAGSAWYRQAPEYRRPRLDGSAVVYPPYRTVRVSAPTTAVFGVAWEEVVSRHVSTCFAVQTYLGSLGGFAVRASAGVAFGVGGYRR
jgi:hypothetical protein